MGSSTSKQNKNKANQVNQSNQSNQPDGIFPDISSLNNSSRDPIKSDESEKSETSKKADAFVSQADSKLRRMSIINPDKYNEAADILIKAANLYKVGKEYSKAADVYYKVYECYLKADSEFDAINSLVQAGTCYNKSNNYDKAIDCYNKVIDYNTVNGKIQTIAKYQKELAEIYESMLDTEMAIECYKKASDNYLIEDATSQSNSCNIKVGQLLCEINKFNDALQIYEALAKISIDNNLLKYNVNEYLLHAGLCAILLNDIVTTEKAIERFKDISAIFDTSKQYKLLMDIIKTINDNDLDSFTIVIKDYDSISPFDNFKISLLTKIKKILENNTGDSNQNNDGIL